MDLAQLSAAFAIGLVATALFVATGGVGLITTPSLIFLGLAPQVAIATDLFAMLGGRLGGLLGFRRAGQLDLALALRLSLIAAAGAVLGAQLLLRIDETLVRRALGVVLVVLLAFLLLRPGAGTHESDPPPSHRATAHVLFFFVGLWGTLVGAGFISLGSAVLLVLLRRTFLESAALLTLIGLAIGGVGLMVFGVSGIIDWPVGLALLVGKALGGYLGSLAATRVGNRAVRWAFIAVVLASALALHLGA